jgi:hypothetical protein
MAHPPALARNPLSIAGAWLATVGAIAFLTYLALDAFGLILSPYSGLLGYVLVPAVFVAGLVLIPIGIWREGARRRRGQPAWSWPAIDLARTRTRQVLVALIALTLVNLAIVTVATVGATHYMETDEFCGQVCHEPMRPQATAHRAFPHAAVPCVACHVAPGAAGAVRAKLNGTRQAWEYVTNAYRRPIASPAANVPGGVETCVHCHALDQVPREITRVIKTYDNDEASTESATTLDMLTGAAHWHARPDVRVEYISDPTREQIGYVRVLAPDGQLTEYLTPELTARPAGALRRMDCLDCHSRPAHTMSMSAEQAVDRAIAAGDLARTLPYVRREAVAALAADYVGADAAANGIRDRLTRFYAGLGGVPSTDLAAAIGAVNRLYRTNVFPEMRITWGTYKSHLGHVEMSGCFRCHNDTTKAADGRVIRQECELCHRMP